MLSNCGETYDYTLCTKLETSELDRSLISKFRPKPVEFYQQASVVDYELYVMRPYLSSVFAFPSCLKQWKQRPIKVIEYFHSAKSDESVIVGVNQLNNKWRIIPKK